MKDIRRPLSLLFKILLVFSAIFLFFTNSIPAADPEHYSEETLITLEFENKSLNQVLKEISWITGYSFVINKEYADLEVSGSLKKVPLHQGLKEIVGKRSHTITYEPNKTVFLTLYKSSPPVLYTQNVTDLSYPLNYTIRPDNMNHIQTESDSEETSTETDQAQWEDYQDDIQEDAVEGDYVQDDDEVYDDDAAFENEKPIISQRKSFRLRGTEGPTETSNTFEPAARYNDYQDGYEDEEIENSGQQFEEGQYEENISPE